jgi:NTE family protein
VSTPVPITNLVFEGGGVKGVAYCGALHELEGHGILPGITSVAGTSAGAITAALVAAGCTPEELTAAMLDLDFHKFEDGMEIEGPVRVVEHYGWYRGQAFLKWMQGQIEGKLGSPDATFEDLSTGRRVDLRVVATNLATRTAQVFSVATTPTVPIAEAVRMSMSIPLFFEAVTFNGAVHVDGGAVWNYPIEMFDDPSVSPATIGFRLDNLSTPRPPPVPIHDLAEFAKGLWETVMNAQGGFYTRNPEDVRRSVVIDDLGLRATDFGLSNAQKQALIDNGAKATSAFLAAR